MKTKWPPNPESVISDLSSMLALVYPALDAGVDHALQYFEGIKKDDKDPWLFTHLVRHHSKDWLAANEIAATGFQLKNIPMSGLWLHSSEYDIRILKYDHRPGPITDKFQPRIQVSKTSRRRQFFYQPSFEFDEDLTTFLKLQVPQRLNLVLLWDHDADYKLAAMELACPRRLSQEINAVECHWWVSIPRDGATGGFYGNQGDPGQIIQLDDIQLEVEYANETTGVEGDSTW